MKFQTTDKNINSLLKGTPFQNIFIKSIFILAFVFCCINIQAQDFYITTTDLNLREGAGKNYKSLIVLTKGDTVKILDNSKNYWAKIQHKEKIGFSAKQYLQKIDIVAKKDETVIKNENSSGFAPFLICLSIVIVFSILLKKIGQNYRYKSIAVILSFLGGIFGFQKFYLGKVNKGIFSILFCWTFIPLLIGLIDFTKILRMKKTKFNNLYNNKVANIKQTKPTKETISQPIIKNNFKEKNISKQTKQNSTDETIIDVNTQNLNLSIPKKKINRTSLPQPPYWEHTYIYSYDEINHATKKQKEFYFYFKNQVLNGKYVDILGNTNYAFILYFDFLNEYKNHKDIKLLEKQIKLLEEICPKIKDYSHYRNKEKNISKQVKQNSTDETIIDVNTQNLNLSIPQKKINRTSLLQPPYWEHTYIYSYDEINHATKKQKEFYFYFKNQVLNGKYIDILGNTNYAFILYFDFLNEYKNHRDIKLLEEQFKLLGEICPKTKTYSLHSLLEELRKRTDSYSVDKLQELKQPYYQFEHGYSDYNPDLYKLGYQYKDKLGLNKQEIKWLNKFYNPTNVFLAIEGCCIATITQYVTLLKELEKQLKKNDTTLAKEITYIKGKLKAIYYKEDADWGYYNTSYYGSRAESEIYLTLFKRVENSVRESFRHKRKVSGDFPCSDKILSEEFEIKLGNPFNTLIKELKDNINQPDLETQIELNYHNIARWRDEFTILKELLSKGDKQNFIKGIEHLESVNQKNPNIENILYDASKLIAKYDKVQSLKYYAKYIYYDLNSKKIDNKELTKTVKKSLFKTEEQINDFREIIAELVENKDIQTSLEKISKIYISKRKRIQLNHSEIQEVEQKHEGTVKLLNEYLDDEKEKTKISNETEEDIEIVISKKNNSVFISEISMGEVQEKLVKMITNNSFEIHQDEVNKYAAENGMFKNQLIDSINEACEEHLDGEALIEEDEENYIIEKSYYNEIIK